MNFYPHISDRQSAFCPASWVIEPVKEIAHGGISGLMVNRRPLNPMGEVQNEIPETFYGKELVTLATGTNAEIVSVSKKYGLLVSPFSSAIYKRRAAKPLEITEPVIEAEKLAIHESVKLAQMQEATEEGLTGTVVSLSEIRATAGRLLDALKTIRVIGSGLSVNELSVRIESNELPSFPIQNLRYIEHCLEGSGLLGISLTLVDEKGDIVTGSDIEELEALSLGREIEVDVLRQLHLLRSVCAARPRELVSLTGAVALGIRNFAIELRQWTRCDHCKNEFPIKVGQKRETKKEHGTYCCPDCKNAAAQKRYRERKKLADTSAQ